MGRLVPPLEEGGARSKVSEWELRELREREEEREAEAEELGAAGQLSVGVELPLFLFTPPLHGTGRRGVGAWGRCPLFFPLSLICYLLGALYIFLGQAWAEGKGELATCRHRADCGQEKCVKCTPP